MMSPIPPWRRPSGDDGVAIVMSLGYIIVFSALMLSVLAIVVGQVKPTAQAKKDIGSLNAASSGLQAGLAALRSASDGFNNGIRGNLPCTAGSTTSFQTGTAIASTPGAKLSAVASPLPGSFAYTVSIGYYASDPTDKPASWLQTNALPCPLTATPGFAYLQSNGTGANIAGAGGSTGNRGNRSQTGVYTFSIPVENIAGGRLRAFGTSLCLDAGIIPASGTAPTFQTCQPLLAAAGQTWEYRSDLSLFFAGKPALNLCIEGSTSAAPVLRRCTGTGYDSTYPYAAGQQVQEWPFNDNGHFAAAAGNGNVSSACLQPSANAVGAAALVTSCVNSITDYTAIAPDPEVGAGKAGGNVTGLVGSPTNQYVNFAEFGRCLDITGQNVNADHLIAYPCKQAPDSTNLTFNQVWNWTTVSGALGRMNVTQGGVDFCLTAPAAGRLVLTKQCSSTRTDQQWTAAGRVAGSPTTSYTLKSQSAGTCLSVSQVGALSAPWSDITAEPCDGSTKQRWNAPPVTPDGDLNNIAEGSAPR